MTAGKLISSDSPRTYILFTFSFLQCFWFFFFFLLSFRVCRIASIYLQWIRDGIQGVCNAAYVRTISMVRRRSFAARETFIVKVITLGECCHFFCLKDWRGSFLFCGVLIKDTKRREFKFKQMNCNYRNNWRRS